MPYYGWITLFFLTPLIFRYHLPLKALTDHLEGGREYTHSIPTGKLEARIFFYLILTRFRRPLTEKSSTGQAQNEGFSLFEWGIKGRW